MSEYFNLLVNNCQVAGYLISWSLELELESGIVDFLFRSFQRRGAEAQSTRNRPLRAPTTHGEVGRPSGASAESTQRFLGLSAAGVGGLGVSS